MQDHQHSEEPWCILPASGEDGSRGVYIYADGEDVCDLYTERKDEHGIKRGLIPFPHAEANAKRIVECVNACAGIDNPSAIPLAIAAIQKLLGSDAMSKLLRGGE